MAISPFRFQNISKISKEDLERSQALLNFLPDPLLKEQLFLEVRKELIKQFGQEVLCFVESMREENYKNFLEQLPENALIAVIDASPAKGKLFCQIDTVLAARLIDKLLGTVEGEPVEMRRLTETEQGVLQYTVMRMLQAVDRAGNHNPRLHFRFDRFALSRTDLAKVAKKEEKSIVVTVRVGFSEWSSYIKLVFPYSMIHSAFVESVDTEFPMESAAKLVEMIDRFGFVRTAIWAEAGRCELTLPELRDLEEGDVILFDDTQVQMHEGQVEGFVTLRVGSGNEGELLAEIDPTCKRVTCKIQ